MEALIPTRHLKILYLLEQEQMMISPLQLLSSHGKGLATECQCKIAKIEKKTYSLYKKMQASLSVFLF